MHITKSKLKNIINEEIQTILNEGGVYIPGLNQPEDYWEREADELETTQADNSYHNETGNWPEDDDLFYDLTTGEFKPNPPPKPIPQVPWEPGEQNKYDITTGRFAQETGELVPLSAYDAHKQYMQNLQKQQEKKGTPLRGRWGSTEGYIVPEEEAKSIEARRPKVPKVFEEI